MKSGRMDRAGIEMSVVIASTLALAVAIAVSACTSSSNHPERNTNPQKEFRVEARTLGLNEASEVSAVAHYLVQDEKCIARDYTKALGGFAPGTSRQEPLAVEEVGDGVFEASAFDDFYIPTRLSSRRKPCVYTLASISFTFASDGLSRTSFISRNALDARESVNAKCSRSNANLVTDTCIRGDATHVTASSFLVTTKRI